MDSARWAAPLRQALDMLGGDQQDSQIQQAAWVARCVGRGENAPLGAGDIAALAATLTERRAEAGEVLFGAGSGPAGVWIVRHGQVELAVGSGRRRAVVGVLRPGDVDGDIAVLLGMPAPYTARAIDEVTCLHLSSDEFDRLLNGRAAVSRRWLSSVAERLVASHVRVMNLLGRTLTQQTAALLCDEVTDGQVRLPQRTLAAMLGVQRPSLNKVLKDFERQGLISLSYATVTVIELQGLRDLAHR